MGKIAKGERLAYACPARCPVNIYSEKLITSTKEEEEFTFWPLA